MSSIKSSPDACAPNNDNFEIIPTPSKVNVDPNSLTDDVNEDFICPLCCCILWQPVACQTCKCFACLNCINKWLDKGTDACPISGKKNNLGRIFDLIFRSKIKFDLNLSININFF